MRVKIGNEWYSDNDQPIMIELTEGDKKNISNMAEGATRYAVYPTNTFGGDSQLAFDWMDDKIAI